MLCELLKCAHYFLNPRHLFHKSIICHPRMFYRLFLECVIFFNLLTKSPLQELLTLVDRIGDLTNFFHRVADMFFGLLGDQGVLGLLLVAHLFYESGHLLHCSVNLRHYAFLTFESSLLKALLDLAQHF